MDATEPVEVQQRRLRREILPLLTGLKGSGETHATV
jgi:hypothetical protein